MSDERAVDTDSPTIAGRVDAACDRFEKSFRQGRRPRIEDYLVGVEDSERHLLLRELVALEAELRRRHGECPEPGDYRARFPDHAPLLDVLFGAAIPPIERPGPGGRDAPTIVASSRVGG